MSEPMKDSMTVREAATLLGVTPRTVYLWIRAGRLRAQRISERVTRVEAIEVARLLNAAQPPAGRPDLSAILWDIDPACIDEERDARLLIRRILEAGRPEHVRWMFRRYSRDLVRDVAENDRGLSARASGAWKNILAEDTHAA